MVMTTKTMARKMEMPDVNCNESARGGRHGGRGGRAFRPQERPKPMVHSKKAQIATIAGRKAETYGIQQERPKPIVHSKKDQDPWYTLTSSRSTNCCTVNSGRRFTP